MRQSGAGVTIDWYAYRGKGAPKLASYRGDTRAAAERAEAGGAKALAAAFADVSHGRTSKAFVTGLITAYKASPAWLTLRASTKAEWKRWLDRIDIAFGEISVRAMGSRGARALILDWRDKFADRPRSADYGIQVLSRVLSWAKDREFIERNPAEGIESLYAADRSDQIWEPAHMRAVLAIAPDHVGAAIEVLAHTGLRVGDAVALTWAAVDLPAGEVVWATSKSNGKREAVIPITKELRAVLRAIPRAAETVLTSAKEAPWSDAGALSKAIQKAARKAKVSRRTHDLRGTAATNFVAAGLTYPEVAMIMAWTEKEVERIARRYVSKGAVSRRVARRINAVAAQAAETDAKGEK